jgi:pimeloyl-ACP methyl ester carboxylesterase
MPYTESAGADIYWEVQGQGEPLLLIFGLGGASDQWYRITPALSARFQTILFDNRGIGRSSVPPPPYSIEGMADDAAAVLDAAGVSSAHVMGNSMGGMIAQELTLRHPERVRSLILGCTACGGRAAVPATKEVRAALTPDPSLSREEVFWTTAWSIYDPSTPRQLLEEDLAVRLKVARTAAGYSAQFQAIRAWQGTLERLGTIRVPTLVLHGENDLLIPPANAEILARAIPGAKLVMLPGAAHIFLTDKLGPARDAILSFLESCVASAA